MIETLADSGGRMTAQASPEQNDAYRAGLCIGRCGRPHSAGRPRCDTCHTQHLEQQGRGDV